MVRWFLGLAVIVFAASASPAQNAAKKVIEAAIQAHGGADNLRKFKAGETKFTGDITIAGMEIPFTGTVTHEVPGKFHMTLNVDVGGVKQTITQVVNGKLVAMTVNGQSQTVSDAQKIELIQAPIMQEIAQLSPLLDDPKRFTLAPEADTDVGGKPAAVVRVTAVDPKLDVRLFFDKESKLLVKTARRGLSPDEREVLEESVQSHFQVVSGTKLPMTVIVTHDGKKFMSIKTTAAKMLDKVDPKLFKSDL